MKYHKHIFICTNERPEGNPKGCCKHKGSDDVRAAFKGALKAQGLNATVRANAAGCLDACQYGVAVVVYPDAVWYGGVRTEDVQEIIQSHIKEGNPVERLRIPDPRYTPDYTPPAGAND